MAVPLHVMSAQPWTVTGATPHPLAALTAAGDDSAAGGVALGEATWLSSGTLPAGASWLAMLQAQPGLLACELNEVPLAHMWSPAFVPRPDDWPAHAEVVGAFNASAVTIYMTTAVGGGWLNAAWNPRRPRDCPWHASISHRSPV